MILAKYLPIMFRYKIVTTKITNISHNTAVFLADFFTFTFSKIESLLIKYNEDTIFFLLLILPFYSYITFFLYISSFICFTYCTFQVKGILFIILLICTHLPDFYIVSALPKQILLSNFYMCVNLKSD